MKLQIIIRLNREEIIKTAFQVHRIFHRYGGPDSYQVTEKFDVDWGTYLVTNKSIIYATIDGRGSGLMDNGMLFAGYRNLGTVEIADQINVTR